MPEVSKSNRIPPPRQSTRSHNLFVGAVAALGIGAAATVAVRASRRFDFRGKVVVITGGSRGLGLVLARQFAAEGARVAICGRDPATLNRAVEDLGSRGAQVVAVPCDVSSREDVERMIGEVVNHFGGIDVVVNNAGTITVGPMETMTLADYEEAMRTHFWGPLYVTMAALPHLRTRGAGRIVNIASIGGKVAVPHLLPYSASKFALVGFSEGLRAELQKDNIFVTTVCPGLMRTGSPRNASFKGQHCREYTWFQLGDSIPGSSMCAMRAGRQIVDACRFGRAGIVLSVQAKAAATLNALFPGFTSQLAAAVNHHVLPAPGGIGENAASGADSETLLTRSFLTGLSRTAEQANNEQEVSTPGSPEGSR